jgi:hypothetical protein
VRDPQNTPLAGTEQEIVATFAGHQRGQLISNEVREGHTPSLVIFRGFPDKPTVSFSDRPVYVQASPVKVNRPTVSAAISPHRRPV